MTLKFRAPVAAFNICRAEVHAAIDSLLDLPVGKDGLKPACVRLDLYVASTDVMTLVKSSASLFNLDASGELDGQETREMRSDVRLAFAEVLLQINDDYDLTEVFGAYPMPWSDGRFSDAMNGRYLSVIFLGKGAGCVLQEYLPSWVPDNNLDDYLEEDASPELRSELMSIFLPENQSNHEKLASEVHVQTQTPVIAGIFRIHSDYDLDAELGEIDFSDILKH